MPLKRTTALFVSSIRFIIVRLNHFTNKHHFAFEAAIWYWQFIDIVWLFLFINLLVEELLQFLDF